jgi:hypothetical protein
MGAATQKELEVSFYRGEKLKTRFNGTLCAAIAYYINKPFNFGIEGDDIRYGCGLVMDGIGYNLSTHRYITDAAHERNLDKIAARAVARLQQTFPRVGDILLKGDKVLRFTHNWDDSLQVTTGNDATHHGGFYLNKDGSSSFSGTLDPSVPLVEIEATKETREAAFWTFHNDDACAHNGINFYIPVRVWQHKAGDK